MGNGIDDDCDNLVDNVSTPTTPDPNAVDQDGDGFTPATGDCDDSHPFVYPGALEYANGIDDDCDGIVDNVDSSGEDSTGPDTLVRNATPDFDKKQAP